MTADSLRFDRGASSEAANWPAWISVSERLPEIVIDEAGNTNSVLALWRPGKLASNLCNPSTSNTVYFRKHVHEFSHWMPLPPPPVSQSATPVPAPAK